MTATRKRKLTHKQAQQLVGEFMQHWAWLEGELASAVEKIFKLDMLDAAIINANLAFQGRVSVFASAAKLYGGSSKSKEWHAHTKKLFAELLDLNDKWRIIVAHCAYSPEGHQSVRFYKIQAKRELKIPEIIRSRFEFKKVAFRLHRLSNEIEKLRDEILTVRKQLDRTHTMPPNRSIAELGLYGYLPTPSLETQRSPTSILERLLQMPENPSPSKGGRE
jgi:hypothetical protein